MSLLRSEVRRDRDRVSAMLHADFMEIGRSGRLWIRAEIVAALGEEPDRAVPEADEWQFHVIAEHLVLVTFRIRGLEGDSRHSSIWDFSTGHPVLRFHQGTAVART